jgi:hypothetical protein
MELQKLADNYGWRIKINKFSTPIKANELAESAIEDFTVGYETAQKELYTKEDVYNCLGDFAYKYGITINGNDLTKWLKDKKL